MTAASDPAALSGVFERLGEIAFAADPAGVLRAIAPGCERLLGRGPEALVGVALQALIAREDHAKLHELLSQLGAGGPLDAELRLHDARAPARWIRLRAVAEAGGIVGCLRDMHARRNALESERWLFDAGPVIAFRWANEPGWPIEDVSRNVRQLGYAPEALVQERRSYLSMMHPDDLPSVGRALEGYLAAQAPTMHFAYRLLDAAGRIVHVEGHAVAERDELGRILSFRGYIVDATERLASEATQARAQQDFQEIIENSVDLVLVHRGGRVLFINPIGAQRLGWESPAALLGRSALELVDPADREEAEARVKALWRTGRPSPAAELRMLRRDGGLETFEFVELKLGFRGEPAVIALGRDVTERRRLSARMMQLDRMVAVGTLATGVAHEINNPLAFILANLAFVLDELRDLRPRGGDERDRARFDELVSALQEAREGAERVRDIVLDLKTIARPDPQSHELTELGPVLRSAIAIARLELHDRAEVALALEELPPVSGPSGKLGQVFLNLLVNAAHAIPPGAQADNAIRVSGRHEGAQVVVEIADTGVGIAPEHLPRIFDPFFTTKPVGKGTGLGLSICQSIVKAVGGEISVSSTQGVGTTFTVRLPAARREQPEPPRANV